MMTDPHPSSPEPILAHITPINVAEAIVDPLWDPKRGATRHYSIRGGTLTAFWCWMAADFDNMTDGGAPAVITRAGRIDAQHYDTFILRLSCPSDLLLTVTLRVDGVTQTVLANAPGANTFREYGGRFTGRMIEEIVLSFRPAAGATVYGVASVEWTGLAHSERLPLLKLAEPEYPPDWAWSGYLLQPDQITEDTLAPALGLFFGTEDLERLRRKILRPGYRETMDRLREIARASLAQPPEQFISDMLNGSHTMLTRDRYCSLPKDLVEIQAGARLCAFVGLMDRDRTLLSHAARQALCMAHCRSWLEWNTTFVESTWEPRCFKQYRTALGCLFALDWAGCGLTESGRDFIINAVAEKALPGIQRDFMKHDYIRGCNQGLFFAWGWMVSLLGLSRFWPHAKEWLDMPRDCIVETLNRYVLSDGGSDEGVGYQTGSIAQGLLGLIAYARRRGVPAAGFVPEHLARVPQYIAAMLSTARPGTVLPIADGGRLGVPPFAEGIAALAHIFPDRPLESLLARILRIPFDEGSGTPGRIFCILYGPEELPEPEVPLPTFLALPQAGMLASARPTPDGVVRVHLTGGKAHAGHAHEDRGSLILEAFGEELFVDGGQIMYTNPRANLLTRALYHNLFTPGGLDDPEPRQLKPCRVATIPDGHGDERSLRASIVTTGAWGEPVTACKRSLESDTPTSLTIRDEMTLSRAMPAVFRLNAVGEFRELPGKGTPAWELISGRARAVITPQWRPSRAAIRDIGTDGAGRMLHQLALESPAAAQHDCVTTIELACWPV